MPTQKVFSTLPGFTEEERMESWAQQIGCNVLLYEIFMRLDKYGRPMRVTALTEGIWFRHRFEWKRSYVEDRIRRLAYGDRILTTKRIQSWTYVGLHFFSSTAPTFSSSRINSTNPILIHVAAGRANAIGSGA